MALPFATPASLSPSFVIARCDAGDVDDMCDIYYEAFKEDPGNSHWWSPDRRHMQAWMQRRMVKKLGDAGMRHFKIVDVETGAMVAFARWDIPEGSEHFGEWLGQPPVDVTRIVEDEPEKPKDAEQEVAASAPAAEPKQQKYADIDVPEGADPFLCQNFFGALTKASEKWYTKDMLGELNQMRGYLAYTLPAWSRLREEAKKKKRNSMAHYFPRPITHLYKPALPQTRCGQGLDGPDAGSG